MENGEASFYANNVTEVGDGNISGLTTIMLNKNNPSTLKLLAVDDMNNYLWIVDLSGHPFNSFSLS